MLPWLAAALPVVGKFVKEHLPQIGNFLGNVVGVHQQKKANMELVKYQNQYNSPASQMARYDAAGLNRNLVYNQGNPGNMDRPPTVDVQNAYADLGTKYAQIELMKSQTGLTDQKTKESGVKQDLARAQTNLVKANPYLNPQYVYAMVTQLQSAASIKATEAEFMTTQRQLYDEKGQPRGWDNSLGFKKMEAELNLLIQRYNLGKADQQIKAKVLESKEFQNSLQQIQVEWMKNGDITPQHIYQGIMMLLMKLM